MEFNQTQTFNNLARAFASEAQAQQRYVFIAQQALKQGYKTLSFGRNKLYRGQRKRSRESNF